MMKMDNKTLMIIGGIIVIYLIYKGCKKQENMTSVNKNRIIFNEKLLKRELAKINNNKDFSITKDKEELKKNIEQRKKNNDTQYLTHINNLNKKIKEFEEDKLDSGEKIVLVKSIIEDNFELIKSLIVNKDNKDKIESEFITIKTKLSLLKGGDKILIKMFNKKLEDIKKLIENVTYIDSNIKLKKSEKLKELNELIKNLREKDIVTKNSTFSDEEIVKHITSKDTIKEKFQEIYFDYITSKKSFLTISKNDPTGKIGVEFFKKNIISYLKLNILAKNKDYFEKPKLLETFIKDSREKLDKLLPDNKPVEFQVRHMIIKHMTDDMQSQIFKHFMYKIENHHVEKLKDKKHKGYNFGILVDTLIGKDIIRNRGKKVRKSKKGSGVINISDIRQKTKLNKKEETERTGINQDSITISNINQSTGKKAKKGGFDLNDMNQSTEERDDDIETSGDFDLTGMNQSTEERDDDMERSGDINLENVTMTTIPKKKKKRKMKKKL